MAGQGQLEGDFAVDFGIAGGGLDFHGRRGGKRRGQRVAHPDALVRVAHGHRQGFAHSEPPRQPEKQHRVREFGLEGAGFGDRAVGRGGPQPHPVPHGTLAHARVGEHARAGSEVVGHGARRERGGGEVGGQVGETGEIAQDRLGGQRTGGGIRFQHGRASGEGELAGHERVGAVADVAGGIGRAVQAIGAVGEGRDGSHGAVDHLFRGFKVRRREQEGNGRVGAVPAGRGQIGGFRAVVLVERIRGDVALRRAGGDRLEAVEKGRRHAVVVLHPRGNVEAQDQEMDLALQAVVREMGADRIAQVALELGQRQRRRARIDLDGAQVRFGNAVLFEVVGAQRARIAAIAVDDHERVQRPPAGERQRGQ